MKHLDTNILIDVSSDDSKCAPAIRQDILDGIEYRCSAITWAEFRNGPCTEEQVTFLIETLAVSILPFTRSQAEASAQLFNATGRRRGSKSDCMIAACAISEEAPLSTLNFKDFERFVPHGLKLEAIPLNSN